MNVAIIIPHYGSQDKLHRCIQSIIEHTACSIDKFQYTIFVYDDASAEVVKGLPPRIRYKKFAVNSGFTSMVNSALMDILGGKYEEEFDLCAIFNNDLTVGENWQNCLNSFDDPAVGIVSPMICATEDHNQVIFAGTGSSNPGVHVTCRLDQLTEQQREEFVSPRRYAWLTFACVIIRAETLRHVGLLDPNMRHICSDSDWCFRATSFGWKCMFNGSGIVYHSCGVATRENNPFVIQERMIADRCSMEDKWRSGRLFFSLENCVDGSSSYGEEWVRWRYGIGDIVGSDGEDGDND